LYWLQVLLAIKAGSTLASISQVLTPYIGGSVAKLLLKYPDTYTVRCLTRNVKSESAQALERLGAEIISGDLTKPSSLPAATSGCWGVFAVTNFYDSVIQNPITFSVS
jgi:uncharacterized protein YbjT (DUF2867 family)